MSGGKIHPLVAEFLEEFRRDRELYMEEMQRERYQTHREREQVRRDREERQRRMEDLTDLMQQLATNGQPAQPEPAGRQEREKVGDRKFSLNLQATQTDLAAQPNPAGRELTDEVVGYDEFVFPYQDSSLDESDDDESHVELIRPDEPNPFWFDREKEVSRPCSLRQENFSQFQFDEEKEEEDVPEGVKEVLNEFEVSSSSTKHLSFHGDEPSLRTSSFDDGESDADLVASKKVKFRVSQVEVEPEPKTPTRRARMAKIHSSSSPKAMTLSQWAGSVGLLEFQPIPRLKIVGSIDPSPPNQFRLLLLFWAETH